MVENKELSKTSEKQLHEKLNGPLRMHIGGVVHSPVSVQVMKSSPLKPNPGSHSYLTVSSYWTPVDSRTCAEATTGG